MRNGHYILSKTNIGIFTEKIRHDGGIINKRRLFENNRNKFLE